MFINMNLGYSILLIKATAKKSFEGMASLIHKSGDFVKRRLNKSADSTNLLSEIARYFFGDGKELYLAIDDTLIKKIYSRYMQGSGRFYDTQIARKIMAFKLFCSIVTDGRFGLPLGAAFLFDKDLLPEPVYSKFDLVEQFILKAQKLFPKTRIIVVLDGAFAAREFLNRCTQNSIPTEVRMHSNRKVVFQGQCIRIRDIKDLIPKGRHMARTIKVLWHEIPLSITAQRRIDKHGVESIIYQAATFEAKPSKHVSIYKKRWAIEKMFRTTKQHLGLQDCYSLNIAIQMNHITSVFLAYALAQLERKYQKVSTPEEAIRGLKRKNVPNLNRHFTRLTENFEVAYA